MSMTYADTVGYIFGGVCACAWPKWSKMIDGRNTTDSDKEMLMMSLKILTDLPLDERSLFLFFVSE